MKKNIYWITILFGTTIISGGTLFVKAIVDYYSETGSIYALGSIVMVVYTIGVIIGIVSNSLFQEVVFLIQNHLKERVEK